MSGIVSKYSSTSTGPLRPAPLLSDNHGREITYLRLGITDRCNLRCTYCMPEKGIELLPHDEILTFEELSRLVAIFCGMGINKVRITGGEPFARLDCISFIQHLKRDLSVPHLYLTTNGVEAHRHIWQLKQIGLSGLNVSLDTLSRSRFIELTRRDRLDDVLRTVNEAIRCGIHLKINSVVNESTADEEIRSLAGLAEHLPVSVRFIELMPFSGKAPTSLIQAELLSTRISRLFPRLRTVAVHGPSTARLYRSAGLRGTIGIIGGQSRCFCARCNKVRITPAGMLKACLYDEGVLDLKRMLRSGRDDRHIECAIRETLQERHIDGRVAEMNNKVKEQRSMAAIGG
jgi:cyclic pyranopterin phosphate synthase